MSAEVGKFIKFGKKTTNGKGLMAKKYYMRKIIVSEFVTVDGVMEAPGGENSLGDRSGWTFPYQSSGQGKFKAEELFACDTLLIGRKTYEGFAAAWPTMKDTGEFGEKINSMEKIVVSTTLENPKWNNTKVIKKNVVENIAKLKTLPGDNILVYGSGDLVQTLLAHDLADEYRLMVFPVVLGIGKKLFQNADEKKTLELVDCKKMDLGVVMLTYQPERKGK